ncbi:MAG: rhodanese-like domain-containing protein [Actinomycetota bacterium]
MDVTTAFERRSEVQFLDVREDEEWVAGRIEGALHVPVMQLPQRMGEIDRARPVVAVCRMGSRSDYAAGWLSDRGYDAHNLDGGMEAWDAAGLPFSTPDGGRGVVA